MTRRSLLRLGALAAVAPRAVTGEYIPPEVAKWLPTTAPVIMDPGGPSSTVVALYAGGGDPYRYVLLDYVFLAGDRDDRA